MKQPAHSHGISFITPLRSPVAPAILTGPEESPDVPFHKAYITEDELAEVLHSMLSGWLTMGPKTLEFENNFGDYVGAKNSVSMNSCTACLHLALKAAGIKDGDEVIIPAITFAATAEVVTYLNAVPVLVDVERETCNIDVARIEEKITKKTKAIIPVHFAGQPCDMAEISDIAHGYKLAVIEDAAHSLPATYRKRMIGSIGDITCFSFYATKSLTTGEGGMATTENDEWANRMKILRLHGISKDAWKRYTKEGSWFYEVVEAGYKYNMTDIQAAIGLAQLRKVDWMWQRRKEIAASYSEAFKHLPEVTSLREKPDRESAWHLYVITLNHELMKIGRDRFIEEMRQRGITTSVHFIPIYRHPYYRETFGYDLRDFPVSEDLYGRTVSLPVYPGMSTSDLTSVINAVGDITEKFRT